MGHGKKADAIGSRLLEGSGGRTGLLIQFDASANQVSHDDLWTVGQAHPLSIDQ